MRKVQGEMKENKQRYEIIMAGSGGQGLVLAGIMLGEAAMLEGKVVMQTQSYEIASRGGFSMAEVIISTEEIIYPHVQDPDVILTLTEESLEKFAEFAERGVPVFYDTTLAKPRTGGHLSGFAFTQMASDRGNVASVNILAMGVLLATVPMVTTESLIRVIRKRFKEKAAELNVEALQAGLELIRSV
jgi:2-oxoglutarate ferredoxin oxidoreductase subunit gamma